MALTLLACGSGSGHTKSTVGGGAGQGVATATQAKTATAKIGQTVTLTSEGLGDKAVVSVGLSNAKQYAKEPGEFGSKPDHGVYLVIDVAVVCKQGTYFASPANFKFVAKDGTASDVAFAEFKPTLDTINLSVGQKTSGKIVFDVSKAAIAGGRIQIDGTGFDFDQPAAYWTL